MSRWKAAGIHLTISLLVACIVSSAIYFFWYPPPYFEVAGGSTLMLLIMGVDVVLGPFLTLVVFRAGKNGLRFDLTMIAVLQVVAFCYGLQVIARARPVFIVFAVDRFIPVYADDLEDKDLAAASRPEFSKLSWSGPMTVGAQMPTDAQEKSDLTMSGLAGKDLEQHPKYYVEYSRVEKTVLAKSKPLRDLASKSADNMQVVDKYLASSAQAMDDLTCLPLHGRTSEYAMVVSLKSGQPLTALPLDPW